jgi:CheY-like chemotaxis protein
MNFMKKVIMSEDIRQLLEKEQSFLNRSTIRAIVAATNEETLALHKAEKADLIIARLTTEGMSGETLCSHIRSDESLRRVSIILICSESGTDVERCTDCGANVFLTFPVNTAVLLQEAYHLLQISPRRSCRLSLKLKLEGTTKNKSFSGTAENISAAGMLFRSSALLEEGDTILCSFSLGNSMRLTASADIVRVVEGERKKDGNLFGIRFSSLSDDVLQAIESFVDKNCAE